MKKINAFNVDFCNRIDAVIAADGKVSGDDVDTLTVIFDFCDFGAEDIIAAHLTSMQVTDDKGRKESALSIKQAIIKKK